jgi:hypothetical protein
VPFVYVRASACEIMVAVPLTIRSSRPQGSQITPIALLDSHLDTNISRMVLTRSQCTKGSENFDAFGASHIAALCREFERSTSVIAPYSIPLKSSEPEKQKVLVTSLCRDF